MNLPNKLTVARICLVPFFIFFMEVNGFVFSICALVIFIIASITDLLDGRIARKYNTITPLGIFLDPLADKLLVSAAFICFIDIPSLNIPAWMVIAIISREFLITGLRSIAASKNVIIPADKAGKFKTTSQIVVIILVLVIMIIEQGLVKYYAVTSQMLAMFGSGNIKTFGIILQNTPFWSTLVATVLTLYSGANYMFKHRGLFKE